MPPTVEEELTEVLERDLFSRHGPVIGHEQLWQALGYGSIDAFRQAEVRQTLPVRIFPLERRRGKFALVRDVARWLAHQYAAQPVASASEPQD
jgi:hypothetical protein